MRTRVLITAIALLAACSSGRSTDSSSTISTGSTDTSAPVTTTPDTGSSVAPTTASPTTVIPTTAPTTSPTTSPPTTVACTAAGDTAAKGSADPLAMSSLVGSDIRTGRHDCFERVVIELAGSGDFPGWAAQYVDDPVRLGESDEFVSIDGNATLLLRMGMWMPTMENVGYGGPIDIAPSNVDHILELRQTENFEGMNIWAIGLDAKYPFTATVLHGPERLVIDIQTS